MSDKAKTIADQFEKANADLIAMLEGLNDDQWQRTLDGEGWPIAVGVCHLAEHHLGLADLLTTVAREGKLPDWAPKSPADLDRINAEIAERNAGCGKREALDLLRGNAREAAGRIRELSDQQLENNASFPTMGREFSAREIAETIMIGHIGMHAPSIQQAVGIA